MVYDLLSRGKANAVSTDYLCKRLHICNRELRSRIQKERAEGLVILSSNRGGYYLPETAAEIEEFVRETNKKAFSTLRCLRSAKKLLRELEQTDGQTTIENGGF